MMGLFPWLRRSSSEEPSASALALLESGEYHLAERSLARARGAEELAMLAECQFQTGRPTEALATARRALPRAAGELRLTLWGTVYECCRHVGDAAGAAEACEHLGLAGQAALVRAGEPLLRVVADASGRRLEVDEALKGVEGPVRWMFARNRASLRPVTEAVRRAEDAASTPGFDPESALPPVRAAARLDPHDPAPPYFLGLVAAHRGEWREAREMLTLTERLAPGWFHVRSALTLIEVEDAGMFRIWHAVAEGPIPPAAKLGLLATGLSRHPRSPHLLHLQGKALRMAGRGREAAAAFRAALSQEPPADLLTRICADLARQADVPLAEKSALLHRAAAAGADLPAVATARLLLAHPQAQEAS
jgi:Flp pilus assembly protein TadD